MFTTREVDLREGVETDSFRLRYKFRSRRHSRRTRGGTSVSREEVGGPRVKLRGFPSRSPDPVPYLGGLTRFAVLVIDRVEVDGGRGVGHHSLCSRLCRPKWGTMCSPRVIMT